jgi:diacylglycerol kinase (ATP)
MGAPIRLVVNPVAGHGRAGRMLPQVTAALAAGSVPVTVCESQSLAHARQLAEAAASQGEIVAAVGGDGTAAAIAGAAAAAGSRFGIIPAGRGNDFARVLGIPAEPAAAARVLISGRERAVDLITASVPGGAHTVVTGSVYAGIPSVAGEIANATTWLPGSLVYPVAALRALARWQPATFRIELSRRGSTAAVHELDGYAVVVANTAYFGAGMQVAPPALPDDGLLDLVLMRRTRRLSFVRALLKVRNGSHVTMPDVALDRGASAVITISRDLPAAADGELLPCAAPLAAGEQLLIQVLPAALRVLVPA